MTKENGMTQPDLDYVPCDEPDHPKRVHFHQQMMRLARRDDYAVVDEHHVTTDAELRDVRDALRLRDQQA